MKADYATWAANRDAQRERQLAEKAAAGKPPQAGDDVAAPKPKAKAKAKP